MSQQDRAIRHYLKLAVDFLTNWDSKTVRSVWLLMSRPGHLSREYFRGSRVRYIKPLQLFLSINVVYYFSIGLFYANTFTTPLSIQLHMNDYYPAYASQQVSKKLQEEQISYELLETKYNEKASVLSRTLIFLLIATIIAWSFFHIVWLYRYFLFEVTLRSV